MKRMLDQLRVGESAKILSVGGGEQLYRKLLNLGFFPGNEVSVLQCSPAYLIQVGFTQIALDGETCRLIEVIVDNL